MEKDAIKNYFAPLAKALFGKQNDIRGPIEQNEIYSLETILKDLVSLSQNEWAEYAFSREPLNGKFGSEKRLEFFATAFSCGKKAAIQYKTEYNTEDPLQLAKKMGQIVEYPMMPQNLNHVFFAEYVEPNHIYIYMDGVYKAKKNMVKNDLFNLFPEEIDISSILLSHELFHVVEKREQDTIWTVNYKIDLRKGKWFKNSSRISVLSEIAAMGFAQEMTGISFSPYVLDSFLVYGYSPKIASGLYEEMMELAKKDIGKRSVLEE